MKKLNIFFIIKNMFKIPFYHKKLQNKHLFRFFYEIQKNIK
jgi:hypothetical protein